MAATYKTLILATKLYSKFNLLYVSSTYGGIHSPTSYHYRRQAIDLGSGMTAHSKAELALADTDRWEAMDGLAAHLYRRSNKIAELFHTSQRRGMGWYVKNNLRRSRSSMSASIIRNHYDHVHYAVDTVTEANFILTWSVQEMLRSFGYIIAVDGIKGPQTDTVLKAFQMSHKLVDDGVVGPLTVAALRKAAGWRPA